VQDIGIAVVGANPVLDHRLGIGAQRKSPLESKARGIFHVASFDLKPIVPVAVGVDPVADTWIRRARARRGSAATSLR